ncbi:MAG: hemerythrin family protein, partial [bacterium]|nr:hemerythrin family protein [bacterium]
IDDDHFILFSLVSQLDAAVYEGKGKSAAAPMLDNLVNYVKVHFGREARLLKLLRYPALDEHTQQHDAFARKILEYQIDHQQGTANLSRELLDYLRGWLIDHIQGADRKYASYLRERGVN